MRLINQICRLILIVGAFASTISYAQELTLPVEHQYSILQKILGYDRNLKQRCGEDITIAVIYQSRYSLSEIVMEDLMEIFETSDATNLISGLPVNFVLIDLSEMKLEPTYAGAKIDVFYVAPLRATSISKIFEISRPNQILTVSTVIDYNYLGLSVGFDLIDKKPKILINHTASKAEGVDFKSSLLKYAVIIE